MYYRLLFVIDIEGDSLQPTKLHCLSYTKDGREYKTITTYDRMRRFLTQDNLTLVMHNGVMFDKVWLQKLLGIQIKAKIIDTLGLSWYLYPQRNRHGLESWGDDFGVPKPEIDDWVGLSIEEYSHRCEEDVKITWLLWQKEKKYLQNLYGGEAESLPIVAYLTFKLECAALAEKSRIKLNIDLCKSVMAELEQKKEEKEAILTKVMPVVQKIEPVGRPAKLYKKNGDVSEAGKKWFALLDERGLPHSHVMPIMVVKSEELANPSSPDQMKKWLFSLGWEPQRYETSKSTGKEVPQLKKNKQDPDLCPSVMELADKEPAILELEGLSIVNHRLGIVKGFLEDVDEEGFIQAGIQGFTNTLRFKHKKPLVNLPGIEKPYGEQIRGCLIVREGHLFIGSDMVSLEDSTKKHFIFPYDPKYVEEMSEEGFDPHLDLAITAGLITKQQMKDHVFGIINLTAIRKPYKVVNYSSLYGIGPPKLAKDLKITVKEARALLKTYWKRNWAVKKVAEEQVVKTVDGQTWLLNPVSKMYYSLRADKDRFSTLNQGTGVYVFDSWIKEVVKRRPQLSFQMHDEILIEVKEDEVDTVKAVLNEAVVAVNNKLKLNIRIGINAKKGTNYADCH